MTGPNQQQALSGLDEEYANISATFHHFVDLGNRDGQYRLCTALRTYWIVRGHLEEGKKWCTSGDYSFALSWLQGTQEAFRILGFTEYLGLVSYEIGMTLFRQGEAGKARRAFEQILDLGPAVGRNNQASAYLGLGMIEASTGHYAEATEYFSESRKLFTELGNYRQLAHALGNLANIQFRLGRKDDYCALMGETIGLGKKLGDLDGLAISYNNSGYCHACLDEYEKANDCYRELEILAKRTGELVLTVDFTKAAIDPITFIELSGGASGDRARIIIGDSGPVNKPPFKYSIL